ncbi:MAG: right-handed parallel beta-helix repeat-containing protein [Sedimentisphaerales bacterium]|nr:right-handed parallel beta-helix repeat-containing protein [Sedimentisphaerales bacterium]
MKTAICIFVILAATPCRARIITVDDNAPADFNNIQAAIDDANDGDTVEIRPGTYGSRTRDINFLGKRITVRSTEPTDPETVAQTIISSWAFGFRSGEDANSVIDGLTIIDGYALPGGGAIYCDQASPTIRNCTINRNVAGRDGYSSGYGGAIYCDRAAPTIRNCTMTRNVAGWGGAIYCRDSGGITIEDCIFIDNSATEGAGAIYLKGDGTIAGCVFRGNHSAWKRAGALRIREGNVIITDCIFEGNCAFSADDPDGGRGGGMAIAWSEAFLTNCLFAGNMALQGGGAISFHGSDLTVENCTFADNRAPLGNALHGCPELNYPSPSDVHIKNSIIWGEPGHIVLEDHVDSTLLLTFCGTAGVWPGSGNIDADPCFVDPGFWGSNGTPEDANDDFWVDGDYHLKSQAGRWDSNEGRWVMEGVTSPCIDAGDPMSPIGFEPFPNGGRINMGAYGGMAEASKSYFGEPPCETIVAGDINGDCQINFEDFRLMALHWCEDNNP